MIKSILVATDLAPGEKMAVQRAWQLADAHRATVKLMYMPWRGQPVPSHAAPRLASLARQLEESLELRVKTAPVKASTLDDLAAEARGVDLIVLPHRRERSTAAFFRGQPLMRILRRCSCPVLVVRRMAAANYQRILVAVDLSVRADALARLAAELDSRSALEIFHAISTLEEAKLRSAEATDQAVRAYREACLRRARERIAAITRSLDPHGARFVSTVGRGDPGREIVVRQAYSAADLVVIGKARSSAWEDFLCGSVAHRVLSWGSSDVLAVPQAFMEATAPKAARRIRAGRATAALEMGTARGRLS